MCPNRGKSVAAPKVGENGLPVHGMHLPGAHSTTTKMTKAPPKVPAPHIRFDSWTSDGVSWGFAASQVEYNCATDSSVLPGAALRAATLGRSCRAEPSAPGRGMQTRVRSDRHA